MRTTIGDQLQGLYVNNLPFPGVMPEEKQREQLADLTRKYAKPINIRFDAIPKKQTSAGHSTSEPLSRRALIIIPRVALINKMIEEFNRTSVQGRRLECSLASAEEVIKAHDLWLESKGVTLPKVKSGETNLEGSSSLVNLTTNNPLNLNSNALKTFSHVENSNVINAKEPQRLSANLIPIHHSVRTSLSVGTNVKPGSSDKKASRTLYMPNLEAYITDEEIIRKFGKFGHILDVDVKNRSSPTPYALIQYTKIDSVIEAIRCSQIDDGRLVEGGNLKNVGNLTDKNRIRLKPIFWKSIPSNKLWIGHLPNYYNQTHLQAKLGLITNSDDVLEVIFDANFDEAIIVLKSNEIALTVFNKIKNRELNGSPDKSGSNDQQFMQVDFCSEKLYEYFLKRLRASDKQPNSVFNIADDNNPTNKLTSPFDFDSSSFNVLLPEPPKPPDFINPQDSISINSEQQNEKKKSRAISNLCTDEGNHGGASSQNSNLRKEISQSFYSNAKRVRVNETKLPSRSYTHMHSEQKQGGTDKRNYERITIRGRRTQSNSSKSSESCISSESGHSRKNDRKKLVSKRRDWRRLSTRNHRHSWKHRHTRSKSLRATIRNTQELEPRRINAEQKVTGDRASSSRQRTVNSQRIREREQNKEKRRSESSNRIKEPDRRKSHEPTPPKTCLLKIPVPSSRSSKSPISVPSTSITQSKSESSKNVRPSTNPSSTHVNAKSNNPTKAPDLSLKKAQESDTHALKPDYKMGETRQPLQLQDSSVGNDAKLHSTEQQSAIESNSQRPKNILPQGMKSILLETDPKNNPSDPRVPKEKYGAQHPDSLRTPQFAIDFRRSLKTTILTSIKVEMPLMQENSDVEVGLTSNYGEVSNVKCEYAETAETEEHDDEFIKQELVQCSNEQAVSKETTMSTDVHKVAEDTVRLTQQLKSALNIKLNKYTDVAPSPPSSFQQAFEQIKSRRHNKMEQEQNAEKASSNVSNRVNEIGTLSDKADDFLLFKSTGVQHDHYKQKSPAYSPRSPNAIKVTENDNHALTVDARENSLSAVIFPLNSSNSFSHSEEERHNPLEFLPEIKSKEIIKLRTHTQTDEQIIKKKVINSPSPTITTPIMSPTILQTHEPSPKEQFRQTKDQQQQRVVIDDLFRKQATRPAAIKPNCRNLEHVSNLTQRTSFDSKTSQDQWTAHRPAENNLKDPNCLPSTSTLGRKKKSDVVHTKDAENDIKSESNQKTLIKSAKSKSKKEAYSSTSSDESDSDNLHKNEFQHIFDNNDEEHDGFGYGSSMYDRVKRLKRSSFSLKLTEQKKKEEALEKLRAQTDTKKKKTFNRVQNLSSSSSSSDAYVDEQDEAFDLSSENEQTDIKEGSTLEDDTVPVILSSPGTSGALQTTAINESQSTDLTNVSEPNYSPAHEAITLCTSAEGSIAQNTQKSWDNLESTDMLEKKDHSNLSSDIDSECSSTSAESEAELLVRKWRKKFDRRREHSPPSDENRHLTTHSVANLFPNSSYTTGSSPELSSKKRNKEFVREILGTDLSDSDSDEGIEHFPTKKNKRIVKVKTNKSKKGRPNLQTAKTTKSRVRIQNTPADNESIAKSSKKAAKNFRGNLSDEIPSKRSKIDESTENEICHTKKKNISSRTETNTQNKNRNSQVSPSVKIGGANEDGLSCSIKPKPLPPHDELKSSNLLQFGTETGLSSKHDPLKNKCATIYPPRQVPEDEFEVIEQGTILLVKEENTDKNEKNETKVTKKRGPKPKRLADKVEIVAPRSSISEPNSKATDRNVNELSCMDTDVWSKDAEYKKLEADRIHKLEQEREEEEAAAVLQLTDTDKLDIAFSLPQPSISHFGSLPQYREVSISTPANVEELNIIDIPRKDNVLETRNEFLVKNISFEKDADEVSNSDKPLNFVIDEFEIDRLMRSEAQENDRLMRFEENIEQVQMMSPTILARTESQALLKGNDIKQNCFSTFSQQTEQNFQISPTTPIRFVQHLSDSNESYNSNKFESDILSTKGFPSDMGGANLSSTESSYGQQNQFVATDNFPQRAEISSTLGFHGIQIPCTSTENPQSHQTGVDQPNKIYQFSNDTQVAQKAPALLDLPKIQSQGITPENQITSLYNRLNIDDQNLTPQKNTTPTTTRESSHFDTEKLAASNDASNPPVTLTHDLQNSTCSFSEPAPDADLFQHHVLMQQRDILRQQQIMSLTIPQVHKEERVTNSATTMPQHHKFERSLFDKYPLIWQGILAMKASEVCVQLHHICGNMQLMELTKSELTSRISGMNAIRITQRMRLGQAQLDTLSQKMNGQENYLTLVCLPCGRTRDDITVQAQRMKTLFIDYFTSKIAAGVVNSGPNSPQPKCVVHVFPPGEFATSHLGKSAHDLLQTIASHNHLFIIITTNN